ncbi:CRISPR-associated protein Csx16 [Hydrogenophilus thermoluteolus]|uniref:CRISPR-associated protein Csx16 n=1 Tax=Hydrogenophilus thermoluteolus TaxID=297 RepID=A0A2Z6DWY4_HYDTE|nr:CRISPR-associated protein Csx16 [Hydrogenophilus thermoluteolus]BBD76984.1 CRISPR-associated protein Csx16 [Hydrogenophilus thermoluteolus]
MKLISFLGTGKYESVCYHWEGKRYESRFVAEALARLSNVTSAVILATEGAEQTHGQALADAFANAAIDCQFKRIRNGQSPDELWDNFSILTDLLDTEEPALLDITHGFRSQPFFAGAVVAFLRTIRNKTSSVRVVYGAFEARDANNQTPVWDLTPFVELLDITQNIHIFLQSGQAENLAAHIEELGRKLACEWARTKQGPRPKLDNFAKALREFSESLTTVRVGQILLSNGRKPSKAAQLLQAIDEAKADLTQHLPPVARVLDAMRAMVEPLTPERTDLTGDEGKALMASLARLYLSLGRYAETGIVLREGWVNLYATSQATCPGQSFDKQEREKAEKRMSLAGNTERELAGLRNDIEHAGFRQQPLPPQTIREKLQRFLDTFEQAQLATKPETSEGTIWFVSRHPGAVAWAARQGLKVDRQVAHLDPDEVQAGDTVIGTLPVHLAAQVCARKARYLHLSLDLPPEARGLELSADDLERYGARLEAYHIAQE